MYKYELRYKKNPIIILLSKGNSEKLKKLWKSYTYWKSLPRSISRKWVTPHYVYSISFFPKVETYIKKASNLHTQSCARSHRKRVKESAPFVWTFVRFVFLIATSHKVAQQKVKMWERPPPPHSYSLWGERCTKMQCARS